MTAASRRKPPQTTAPATACEVLKLLRTRWLSRAQVAQQLGLEQTKADRWLAEYTLQGLLVQRTSAHKPAKGFSPAEYSLSPHWGGQA